MDSIDDFRYSMMKFSQKSPWKRPSSLHLRSLPTVFVGMELSHFCCLHRSDQLFEACLRVLHRFVTDFSRDLLGQCHHHQHQVGPGAHVGVKFQVSPVDCQQLGASHLESQDKTGGTRYWLNGKMPREEERFKESRECPCEKKKKKQTKLWYNPIYNIIPCKSRENQQTAWCFDWFHHFHFSNFNETPWTAEGVDCTLHRLPVAPGTQETSRWVLENGWKWMAQIPLAHLVIVTLEIAG